MKNDEPSVNAIHDDDDSEERFSRKTRSSQENSRNSACFCRVMAVPAAAARRPQILDFETPGHVDCSIDHADASP